MEKRELRMYGLVPYNISPIQQGIQFGHAVVEYGAHNHNTEEYGDWRDNWKTFIILNGGTTNSNPLRLGTMNQHLETLKSLGVTVDTFYEPDLGDQLTAVVFILDERVFNKKLYPDFRDWFEINYPNEIYRREHKLKSEWVKSLGGQDIVNIREFISQFGLA